MSTRVAHFVIYGLFLPYVRGDETAAPDDDDFELQEAWLDRIEPYDARRDGEGRVVVLSDGMGGRYTAIGFCIARADEEDGFKHITLPRSDLTAPADLMQIADMTQKVETVLGKLGLLERVRQDIAAGKLADCAWHVFSHYR